MKTGTLPAVLLLAALAGAAVALELDPAKITAPVQQALDEEGKKAGEALGQDKPKARPPAAPKAAAAFVLASPAFKDGGTIPVRHTGDGEDASPALSWSGAPAGTRSFALVCDDPDAPDPKAPKMTWVHWVAYDIPASSTGLAEQQPAREGLSAGGLNGTNDFGKPGWGGPKPPAGVHRYVFRLYALDAVLGLEAGRTKKELEAAMQGHILAQAQLVGRYGKP